MATIYVSPLGDGSATGSSALTALPVTSLNKAIQMAGPGGTVIMLSDKGAYDLTGSIYISYGGTPTAPVTIVGQDSTGNTQNVLITGTRPVNYSPANPAGNEVFKLVSGADNLAFLNMTFENVGTAFRAAADITHLSISSMCVTNVQRFFADTAGGTASSATVTGLTIEDVEIHGFSKNAIELKYDTNNVLIKNVFGDSEHQDGDGYAMGIHLAGTVHDVFVSACTMENAISSTTDYWNGDGFATERGVHNVTFENCVARGNADAGFDLKSSDTVLTNAISDANAHNYRLWGNNISLVNAIGTNPVRYGGIGGQYQIQVLNGAIVTVDGGAFADSGTATTLVVMDGGESIAFTETKFIHAEAARISAGAGILGLTPASVINVSATGTFSTNGLTLLEDALRALNQAPDSLLVTGFIIPENSPSGTIVGTVLGHDPNGDVLTYTLSDDAGGRFTIDPHTGAVVVASGTSLDFEQQNSFAIGAVVSDPAGFSYSESIAIHLTDVPEALPPQILNGTTEADLLIASLNADCTVSGLAGNDTIVTLGGNDSISGGAGNDDISCGEGDDVIRVSGTGEGLDSIDGGAGTDRIEAGAKGTKIGLTSLTNVEVISANGFGSVIIAGSAAADFLDFSNTTLTGITAIKAGGADDTIYGSAGADFIVGGAGSDTLRGNAGADRFDYNATGESRVNARDKILDFTPGVDKLDLAGIDASTTAIGNQAFNYLGDSAFTHHAGELRIDTSDISKTIVSGDTNGDGIADFAIELVGNLQLSAGDFFV